MKTKNDFIKAPQERADSDYRYFDKDTEKEKAKILFDAKKKAGLHKPIVYNRECGLSKQEWELDNLADEIVASDSSLERIGILRKFIEQYASLREKETAIEFAIDYEDMDFDLAPIEKFKNPDDWHKEYKIKVAQLFDNWYTKHKEG